MNTASTSKNPTDSFTPPPPSLLAKPTVKLTTTFLVSLLLAAVLVFTACGGGGGGSGNRPGSDGDDEYTLSWSILRGSTYDYNGHKTLNYTNISKEFADAGVPLTDVGAGGYLTGTELQQAYETISETVVFYDSGYETGTFESLVNRQELGIGMPAALKTEVLKQKNKVPVGGVFETSSDDSETIIVFFYIAKN